MSTSQAQIPGQTLFGHPVGLFTLFFAEMWERFSYYGMRALLLFYMIKGFLGYNDRGGYAIYGAYTSLVYMTPFFGGMLADRLLGARRAVVLGGILMAAGHLLMTIQTETAFFMALALLICGNGFFKPNISTMVGSLYPKQSPKSDAGFTIFYMGINLGAAMSPLLCGYVGETYGYHIGFGLATVGMLTGIAVFVAPVRVTQVLIMSGALAAAFGLFYYHPNNIFSTAVNVFTGVALLVAAVVAMVALNRGGLPAEAGAPRHPERLKQRVAGVLPMEWAVYLGTLLFVPVFALLVYSNLSVVIVPASIIESMQQGNGASQVGAVVLEEMSKPAGLLLLLSFSALFYLLWEAIRMDKVPRERMFVVLILIFFSLTFWAFFEQAGSSINNFTDRNVDRVLFEGNRVAAADVGKTIKFRIAIETDDAELRKLPLLSQEQFGYHYGNNDANKQIAAAIREVEKEKGKLDGKKIEELVTASIKDNVLTITGLTYLREALKQGQEKQSGHLTSTFNWTITSDDVGMAVDGSEIPASMFQAVNPIYIILLGVVFSALWTWLGTHRLEPSTPFKFALGLLQLGLGFAALWHGAQNADARGMVALEWLLLGYLLHTTGELCISPVGLSMVVKMSPQRLVATVMGVWFLATAYSQILAAIIAQFTGVHGEGDEGSVPVPKATVHIYGDVFGNIAVAGVISAVICFALSPLLTRWMHEDVKDDEPAASVNSNDDRIQPA